MAGFEVAGPATVFQAARTFRLGKFAPLYFAGIALGVGAGIGLNVLTTPDGASRSHVTLQSPSFFVAAPVEPVAGAASEPLAALPSSPENTLPVEIAVLFDAPIATVPIVDTPAPIAPAALAAPVAAAPAAPAVPAPQASSPSAPKPLAQAAPAPAQPSKPNFYMPEAQTGPATQLEQQLLDSINAERAKAGLPAYAYDAGLTKVARMRSRQLVDQHYFGHTDPYGYSMYVELLAYFGYRYAWAGENLAMNNSPVERSISVAVNGLMNSPTHRANLLADDFFRVGIGEVTAADGSHYYAMIFLG
jgi:uncharacterized protein YkwD